MNSRLLSDIDRSLTVMESLFNRVIERVFIYPYEYLKVRKGIRNSNKGIRFPGKMEKNKSLEEQGYKVKIRVDPPCPKHTKLVTGLGEPNDPLDPLHYIGIVQKENRMDMGGVPRDRRKVPFQKTVTFWKSVNNPPGRFAEYYVWVPEGGRYHGRLRAKYHSDYGWEDTLGIAISPTHWWDANGIPLAEPLPPENAVPNCPRCGLPLKQYEVWDSKRPRERCAWMCIPCKKAGYCIEGRGRTFAEAAADVRDQNVPVNAEPFLCDICGNYMEPSQRFERLHDGKIGHLLCLANVTVIGEAKNEK